MSNEEVRSITLSGTAASEYMGDSGMKKKSGGARRKTRKVSMEGGEEEEPVPMPTPSAVIMKPAIHPTPQVISVNVATPLPPPLPIPSAPSSVPTSVVESTEGGASTRQIKVELKKRASAKRVQLQPKKPSLPSAELAKKAAPTRRVRRFTLGISSLQKRMTRAKKMQKKVADMPLDKLKELLVQKKLIKPTSKAPESVLRQIAADAQIVAGKAL